MTELYIRWRIYNVFIIPVTAITLVDWSSVVEQSVEDNTDGVHIAVRPTLECQEVLGRQVIEVRLNDLRFVRIPIRERVSSFFAAGTPVRNAALEP